MIRSRFDDATAVRIMGLLGSSQALVPALAPIAGAWLAAAYGWPSTFVVTAALAAVVFLLAAARPHLLPAGRSGDGAAPGTYRELFRNRAYLRHAIGFSLVLGGLVVFVFAAPVVIVKSMGGTTADFIILQVVGVSTFIACANSSSWFAARMGTETAVRIGTALALSSGLGLLVYALAGGNSPGWLIPFWIPMNVGMGLRGPTGYIAAIAAAGSNDARASGLIGLFITATMAIGTAVVAPFLDFGLIAPAIAVVLIIGPALALVLTEPPRAKAPAP
jgi:predicted MFS family arabinose efflux permease